jgi:hypothetical protein
LAIERELFETVTQKARDAALRVVRAELGIPKNTVSLSVVSPEKDGPPEPESIVLQVQGSTALTPEQMAEIARNAPQ